VNGGRIVAALAVIAAHAAHAAVIPQPVQLAEKQDRIVVSLGGQPFTEYVFRGHAKPILFPILGPGGVAMTRSWPIVKDVAGEPHDHPHHESLWFMHGNVNGVDFWLHKPDPRHGGRAPRVEQVALVRCESGPAGVIETRNRWLAPAGTVVCTDTRQIRFSGDEHARVIDFSITIHADHGPLTFGDTKEGLMAIRVRPELQPRDQNGSRGAAGTIVNSTGRKNDDAWGKPAEWVDYSGPLRGPDGVPRVFGIAAFDHPANLRHPTTWHARDYGLLAANPFGLHDFTGAPAGTGNHRVPADHSLMLRYRFVFHEGDAAEARIDERYRDWCTEGAAR
jgi:hypothetical protein